MAIMTEDDMLVRCIPRNSAEKEPLWERHLGIKERLPTREARARVVVNP